MSERILLAHGSGGRLSRELIENEIVPCFGATSLQGLPDGATLPVQEGQIVFSTDSYVVQPLFFPGGCIGDLAVHGTINDLAVAGGAPQWLSVALILEEGLEFSVLRPVLAAIAAAAKHCGVQIVTGDTKVVPKGVCDGLYVNTAGIGVRWPEFNLGPQRLEVGDVVIASGTLGDHGMAVLAARERLLASGGPLSDTAPVHRLVGLLREFGPAIKLMRDPTRGGTAAVLNELVAEQPVGIVLQEGSLPFSPAARALAEMVGMDLLQVASEGRFLLVCAASCAAEVVARLQGLPEGAGATIIGRVSTAKGQVLLETIAGGCRFLDVPEGELLPRIC